MYKLLLILKYLRRKITPMFAMLAVTLCTAMVIIVISVMGGFLSLMTESAHSLDGDITISGGLRGFPYYQKLMDRLLDTPEVEAVAAVINNYGLINLGPEHVTHVQIMGIKAEEFDRVIDYKEQLYWKPERTNMLAPETDFISAGMSFHVPDNDSNLKGIVLGIEVNHENTRDETGHYDFSQSIVSRNTPVILTAMAIKSSGIPRPVPKQMKVVNEYKSGLYDVDKLRGFADFDFLQQTLAMDQIELTREDGTSFIDPARVNQIVVRGSNGVSLDQLKQTVWDHSITFIQEYPEANHIGIRTWKERYATFLGAVEKEKIMLTVLFAIISIVAVVMVAVVFYMIVSDKTRDIGVMRAMGASRSGIASIFLGYGLTIGVVGSVIGLALAAGVVYNINEIQDWLTRQFGFTMWDPKIYFFDQIPARLDRTEVVTIMAMAILSGLLGSLIPAFLASRLNPVDALRYE